MYGTFLKPEQDDIGNAFDDFLREDETYEDVAVSARKRVLVCQILDEMDRQSLTKSAMAKRMQTSRAALDRLLDSSTGAVTLNTLSRAAKAIRPANTFRVGLRSRRRVSYAAARNLFRRDDRRPPY